MWRPTRKASEEALLEYQTENGKPGKQIQSEFSIHICTSHSIKLICISKNYNT